ncbi:hypothetical protein FY528_04845 [Hymenobacter lutimineralis]|uniref:Uncharacterized protein n=1 Tax=Hymenobacter lutimineralis TaxID=2606448 RepID=A0A5D6VAR8_9BACT|nr:hypothetical protein [Hymenobacter lutimineralis]TYZ12626.1 hypothetical protein FY528_04845 [Hymenobacter lutimineralis]
MRSASLTAQAAPAPGAASAAPLGAVALRLLGVCRAHHGRAVGLSFLALRAGMGREQCGEELQELAAAGLVCYTSAGAPLWAPRAPWHPAPAGAFGGWGLLREQPQGGHCYQQQAHPAGTCYPTEEAAQEAADTLNYTVRAVRLRPADHYGLSPASAEYHPHPWDLK